MTARPLHSTPVDEGWEVVPTSHELVPRPVVEAGPVPATVPGTVHTDLMAAGLLEDPLVGVHERLQGWVGSTGWRYTTTLPAVPDAGERVDLVFEGLDTVATVRIDGRPVLHTRNMHRTYRVPLSGKEIGLGGARLDVEFTAPVPEADRVALELGYRPHVNHHPYNALRKMAASFGWDWGPDTATSGIWRPVRLESWSTARLDAVVVLPAVSGSAGTVDLRIQVEALDPEIPLTVVARLGEHASARASVVDGAARLHLEEADVRLWWPRGYGEQHRYPLVVELHGATGLLDREERTLGFRTVRLDTEPDASGTPFTVVVNDRPVFVRGVNWIPDDVFPHRIDRGRYAERLGQACDANANLVRVWGGGIYEAEDFHDLCDELGLMVWQDFLFACAAYAEEEPLRGEVEAEAREAVTRLGAHPSLVLLNGNNENLQGIEEWGWAARLEGRTWGAGYYHDLLPGIVAELAPHVAYTPGSPFSPDPRHHANDELNGTTHIWDLWNAKDYPHYRDHRPRFVAEFGWQGPPTWSTMVRGMPGDPLTPVSPSMLVHQKAAEGNVKLVDGLVAHLPQPTTMPDWHWAMSLNQAMAIRVAVEHFRSLQPHLTGIVLWQLNDCWPVVSWSVVDGDGRRKPVWYALREAFTDRLLTLQPTREGLVLAVCNDTDEPWEAPVGLSRRRLDGAVLTTADLAVTVPARSTVRVDVPGAVATAQDPVGEVVVADVSGRRAYWWFAEPRDSALREADLETRVSRTDDGVEVHVTANTLVRELALLADVVDPDAVVDSMLVTLLPGEEWTFKVSTASEVDAAAFVDPAVLRTANGLLRHEPSTVPA